MEEWQRQQHGRGIIKDEVRQEEMAKESFPVVRQRHK